MTLQHEVSLVHASGAWMGGVGGEWHGWGRPLCPGHLGPGARSCALQGMLGLLG